MDGDFEKPLTRLAESKLIRERTSFSIKKNLPIFEASTPECSDVFVNVSKRRKRNNGRKIVTFDDFGRFDRQDDKLNKQEALKVNNKFNALNLEGDNLNEEVISKSKSNESGLNLGGDNSNTKTVQALDSALPQSNVDIELKNLPNNADGVSNNNTNP